MAKAIILFYEGVFCKHKISFLNDYELTELFLNLNDLIYTGNLHKILDGDIFNDNFNTIQLWNDYCFSNYVFPCLDGEFNIDKKYFCNNADIVFRKAKTTMKKEKVIHPDNIPSNKIEQILSTYENDLKPLEQELNFEPILDKFDAALDKIFCKEICDIISDDVVNLEISNIQCISKVVWKCLNDFAAEIILSFIWAGLDTEESDAIIINLRCSLLGKLCELDHQDDSRSMGAWDFSMENKKKIRKIFIDSVDFLKEKVPLQIDEYGNIENILTDNYYYAHLFHQIDDMLYEKNLDNILEEDEEFSLFEIWGNYILKWDTNN